MAGGRPYKEGVSFRLHSTDVESDPRIEILISENPLKGYEVFFRLLDRVYKDLGYFKEWSERQARYLAGKCNTEKEVVDAVLFTAFREGLFYKPFYDRFGILTSSEIQNNFIKAAAKRTRILIVKDFALFDPELIVVNSLQKVALFRVWDHIDEIFYNGQLRPEWQATARYEQISELPYKKQNKIIKDGAIPEVPSPAAVNPIIKNRLYGDKLAPAENLNWEEEKRKLEADEEFTYTACHMFNIGTWVERVFTPDKVKLQAALDQFYQWLMICKDKKTSLMMAKHFVSWYPAKDAAVNRIAPQPGKLKSNLHVTRDKEFKEAKDW